MALFNDKKNLAILGGLAGAVLLLGVFSGSQKKERRFDPQTSVTLTPSMNAICLPTVPLGQIQVKMPYSQIDPFLRTSGRTNQWVKANKATLDGEGPNASVTVDLAVYGPVNAKGGSGELPHGSPGRMISLTAADLSKAALTGGNG